MHLFDFNTGTFILQDDAVHSQVTEIGNWKYWLQVSGKNQDWLGQEVVSDINPVFNFEYLSFIFNHYTDDGSAYSWLLKFKDRETEERFQEGLMQALWENQNQAKWGKAIKDAERDYVLDAFNDLVIEDAKDDQREAEAAEEDEEEEEYDDTSYAQRHEEYDEDESEDEPKSSTRMATSTASLQSAPKSIARSSCAETRLVCSSTLPTTILNSRPASTKLQLPAARSSHPRRSCYTWRTGTWSCRAPTTPTASSVWI